MADVSIIEKIVGQYISKVLKGQGLPVYLVIGKISEDKWHPIEPKPSTVSYGGFKYDIFNAEHPSSIDSRVINPRDLNHLSSSLASQGYEVYAFAYRDKIYKRITAPGSVRDES